MAATIFPAPSASQLTDQGGQVVLARYKNGNVAIPLTAISAGTYFLTAQGSGSLTVSTYTSGVAGGSILTMSVNGSTTSQIVIPSGITGLTFEGSYNGPLVFQTITAASSVIFGAATIQVDANFSDFTSTVWRPIPNSPYWLTWNNGYSSIANMDTGSITTQTTGTRPTYPNGSYLNGAADNIMYAFNPTTGTIVFGNGYAAGNTGAIYRSTDLGLSWSLVQNTTSNYEYWDAAQFVGNNFYVIAGWTGSNSPREYFYVSTNDGVSWTFRDFGQEKSLRKFGYDPVAAKYYGFPMKYPGSSGSTSYTNVVYDLGSTGTTLSQEVSFSPNDVITIWSDYVPTANGVAGAFYGVDNNARFYRWNGTSVSVVNDNLVGSYFAQQGYGQEGFQLSYINIPTNLTTQSAIPYFAGSDYNGYSWFVYFNPSNSSAGAQAVDGAPFSYPSNMASRCTTLSKKPVTNETRAAVYRSSVGSSSLVGAIGTTLISPSGFAGQLPEYRYHASYFSERYQKAYFVLSNPQYRIYRSENATKLTPSIMVDSGTATKGTFYETKSGVLFYPTWDGSSLYINKSTDGTNFTYYLNVGASGYYGGVNGFAQFTTINDVIISTNGQTVGNSGAFRVSTDFGETFFSVTYPPSGNANDVFYLWNDGTYAYARGGSSSQTYRSTDGVLWTSIGQITAQPFWQVGNAAFSFYNNNSTQFFFPGGGAVLQHTSPNSSYSWTPVKFGNGYALLPASEGNTNIILNYFYTSSNGVSWTQRSILANRSWSGGFGGNNFAVVVSKADSAISKIGTSRTVTVQ